jgi:hypothetical protein
MQQYLPTIFHFTHTINFISVTLRSTEHVEIDETVPEMDELIIAVINSGIILV